ncbi:hypothetical protein BLOT_012179 [Blomia tropicalis]|nr:hypothetical protein BLOT_012179 [Blomia tropicalis]
MKRLPELELIKLCLTKLETKFLHLIRSYQMVTSIILVLDFTEIVSSENNSTHCFFGEASTYMLVRLKLIRTNMIMFRSDTISIILFWFSLILFIAKIESRMNPCDASQFMDMKKPPRFGKRFHFMNNANEQELNNRPIEGHRISIRSMPLLCLWPSIHRRNPPMLKHTVNLDRMEDDID